MIPIRLAALDALDKKNMEEYVKEWEEAGEPMVPSSSNPKEHSFETWRNHQQEVAKGQNLPEGIVQADTFFLIEDNGYLHGAIQLRYDLNASLLQYGGHIGYGVRPSSRGKRYSFIMLKQALNLFRVRGTRSVLLTVDRENKASKAVIRRAGGVLQRSVEREGRVIEHYHIAL